MPDSVQKLLSSSLLSKNLKVRIYKTVILPVVLYGCATWTLILREEQRLKVFENKVLRKIFGAKRDEVAGEWRKLHNAELHALYTSLDIIRNIKSRYLRWAGHVACMGESRNAYRVLVGRPDGKRPLGRPRRRWEDNIKMDLREVGYEGRDWINLVQDRDQWRAYVRAAMNLRVRNSNVRSVSDFTGMKPTCVLTFVSAIKGYECRVPFAAVPSHATTLCGGTLPASTRPSTASRHFNHKLRSTTTTTSKKTQAKPHKQVLHRETKSIRIRIHNVQCLETFSSGMEEEFVNCAVASKAVPMELKNIGCNSSCVGYVVVVVDGVGYSKGAREEFEMLRSLQPYLMSIAFGLTLFYNVVIFYNDEVRSEDSPKHYPAFDFWLGKTSEKPNQRWEEWMKKNYAETDQEEKKELFGSLAEKKLPTEGCTEKNGEREKSSLQKI
ncbi:hypothetical protein ANN_11853 [Periplaneta americana]|uniref:Uncharacterized protein n=1 Tax=Periplaneta americana TaxID=6978 RepID=A0ABQ8T672_PERAM|nr:hypothetical protein ANN_11853 [Periplaneta americana]